MHGLKNKRGVMKRFKLTKKGKIKYAACGKGHLMSAKKSRRLRRLKGTRALVSKHSTRMLKRMMPYA